MILSYKVTPICENTLSAAASGLNNNGEVVGIANFSPNTLDGFYWHKGKTIKLSTLLGGDTSRAVGINNNGDITGYCTIKGNSHSFISQNGVLRDLGKLSNEPIANVEAKAINDMGQIVGFCHGLHMSAFLWQNDTMVALEDLSGAVHISEANSCNNNGYVVGTSRSENPEVGHAVIWRNGKITYMMPEEWSYGKYINDNNQTLISGTHPNRGLLLENGKMTDIGSIFGNAQYVQPNSINNKGQMVGYCGYSTLPGDSKAFVWDKKNGILELNTLIHKNDPFHGQIKLTEAQAINDVGQIVAWQRLGNGQPSSYLLTPL